MRTATRTRWTRQSGAALLLCLFALLLLSAIGATLYLSSGTETRIVTNYGNNLNAYYAAKSGLQEVRDRANYLSTDLARDPNGGGLADQLPTDIAGNPNGALYVLNPAPGEVLDPTDLTSRYFDDQLCHDYNSGLFKSSKCNVVPSVAGWALPPKVSEAAPGTASALKWVRINMKTNRTSDPFFVDPAAALDAPICWDGQNERVAPPGPQPKCDGNGLQNVYMLTALAVSPGLRDNAGRRLLRSEIVPPAIRPAGAITMDGSSASVQLSDGNSMPQTRVDGRPHGLDGTLLTGARCSAVAALATDQPGTSTTLMSALNSVRLGIVKTANSQCNADGTLVGSNGTQKCAANLWWVRGTDTSTRFVTTVTVTSTTSGGHDGNDGEHSSTSTVPCDSSTAACYTNLNLGAPELSASAATMGTHLPTVTAYQDPNNPTAPFAGGPGNQTDPSIYQTAFPALFTNQIQAVSALVQNSFGQSNYLSPSPTSLASTYGTANSPAIVVVSGPLNLSTPLSGYGVLVVPGSLQINTGGVLQWNGIVLVQGQNGNVPAFIMGAGSGAINGALMLQPPQPTATNPNPPQQVNLTTAASGTGKLNINYSCDAIDMAFRALSFKTISSSEVSY